MPSLRMKASADDRFRARIEASGSYLRQAIETGGLYVILGYRILRYRHHCGHFWFPGHSFGNGRDSKDPFLHFRHSVCYQPYHAHDARARYDLAYTINNTRT